MCDVKSMVFGNLIAVESGFLFLAKAEQLSTSVCSLARILRDEK
jgi:hypothetical protein